MSNPLPTQPPWEARLAELAALPEGWLDTFSPDPSPISITRATKIFEHLARVGQPLPLIYPRSDGGIELEWRDSDVDLEIEIDNDGALHSYLSPSHSSYSALRDTIEDLFPSPDENKGTSK